MLRKVVGVEAWLKKNSSESAQRSQTGDRSLVDSEGEVDDSGSHFSGGYVAALYDDELYEMAVGRPGVARLQSLGVIFGYNRVATSTPTRRKRRIDRKHCPDDL